MKVCAELFSTATKSERVGISNTIQSSFGYFEFRNLEPSYNTGIQLKITFHHH